MSAIEIITLNFGVEKFHSEVSNIFRRELSSFFSETPAQLEPEVYLTRKDVARLLGVDPSTVTNWRNAGILKSYQIGGAVRYLKSELPASLTELRSRKK